MKKILIPQLALGVLLSAHAGFAADGANAPATSDKDAKISVVISENHDTGTPNERKLVLRSSHPDQCEPVLQRIQNGEYSPLFFLLLEARKSDVYKEAVKTLKSSLNTCAQVGRLLSFPVPSIVTAKDGSSMAVIGSHTPLWELEIAQIRGMAKPTQRDFSTNLAQKLEALAEQNRNTCATLLKRKHDREELEKQIGRNASPSFKRPSSSGAGIAM